MKIKLIACDLDGTLMTSENKLTRRTVDAIKCVIDRGILFVPCTGRSLSAIDPDIMGIDGIKYSVVSNGSEIFDIKTKKLIYSDCIDVELALKVIHIAESYDNICPGVFFDSDIFVPRHCYENPLEFGALPSMLEYFKNTRNPVESLSELLRCRNKPVNKIFLMMEDSDLRKELQNILYKIPQICVTSSGPNNIEVLNKTATKGNALNFLSKYLKISPDNMMALGDSPNDEEMLRFVKYSFAMANSSDYTKSIAKYETLSNDKDGVAAAISKYIMLKK